MLTPDDLRQRLNRFPRLALGSYPTPLESLENLSRQLGGPKIWIKRDDGIGPGMGGNKARKLEFLMAEAQHQGKTKVVTFGGLQSNHARMTAACCAKLGMDAHLYFFEKRPDNLEGNLLLNQLFGARLHFIPFGGGSASAMTIERTSRLVRLASWALTGPGAYFIPVGGHNVTGCLGYVNAALEIQEQLANLGLDLAQVTVVTACGTGGTLAGLMAGFALLGSPIQLLGIDVGKLWKAFPTSIASLAGHLCDAIGPSIRFSAAHVPMVEGTYVGPGYAHLTAEATSAINTMAQTEGILLDPVYTAKAFAGLLDLVSNGRFNQEEHVIFLFTGGGPGLWAFDELLFDHSVGE